MNLRKEVSPCVAISVILLLVFSIGSYMYGFREGIAANMILDVSNIQCSQDELETAWWAGRVQGVEDAKKVIKEIIEKKKEHKELQL